MADQGQWFKLWVSALHDPDLSNLPLDDFARWVMLGAYIKAHGSDGEIEIPPPGRAVTTLLRIECGDLAATLWRMPNIVVATAPVRWPHGHDRPPVTAGDILCGSWYTNGRGSSGEKVTVRRAVSGVSDETSLFVSFLNWSKYQGDFSTSRVRKFREMKRSKRRGEERRREEIKTPPVGPPLLTGNGTGHVVAFTIPGVILEALKRAPTLGVITADRFWQAELRANPGVNYPAEILKAEAWLTAHPERRYKRLSAFLHNWLKNSDREEEPR